MAAAVPPDKLWDLYKIAIDEYRFEINLGWARAMYYMVFNSAVISVATGLLKLDNPPVVYLFVAAIFLLGSFTSLMGVQAVTRCHEYYRRTVVKKTLIENLLGLTAPPLDFAGHTLTIGTTPSQGDHIQILQNTEQWVGRGLRRKSIMFWVTSFLKFLAGIDLIGVFVAGYMFFNPPAKLREPRPPLILPVARQILPQRTLKRKAIDRRSDPATLPRWAAPIENFVLSSQEEENQLGQTTAPHLESRSPRGVQTPQSRVVASTGVHVALR